MQRERSLERGERQLVRTQRALERMAAEPLDELGASDDDAGLRAAEKLVAGEADEVGARREAFPRRRLVAEIVQRPRTEIVHQLNLVALSHLGELRESRPLREADDAEVGLVHT